MSATDEEQLENWIRLRFYLGLITIEQAVEELNNINKNNN